MGLRSLSFFTLVCGELLGFCALSLSPEVERAALLSAPIALGLLLLTGWRLGDRLMLALVAGTVVAGGVAGYFGVESIGVVLSRGLLVLHVLLWLPRDARLYRYWRLGLAFLEIILAAILSPETHMFVIIFLFAMIASLSLSFGFLERKFGREGNPQLPWQFLGTVASLTFLVFLSSLLIFPVLPRSTGAGLGAQWSEPGYTEMIDFNSSISWASGNSRPMVWVFRPEGKRWADIIPFGLLRGAVLDRFTGAAWRPGSKQFDREPPLESDVKLTIHREPMNSIILPAPYGTASLAFGGRARAKYHSGEWPAVTQRNRRVSYDLSLGSVTYDDEPKAIHRELPDQRVFPTIARLAAGWNRRRLSDREKIEYVRGHFQDFKWSLAPMTGAAEGAAHPVENFLQRTKEGHCELFATAAALLFRSMGMPSRLVSGFRVSPSGDVLIARNTDAHAWVEVWVRGEGWLPMDPSPAVFQLESWAIFDLYDQLNAYWYQYIVGYEFDGRALTARWGTPVAALAGGLIGLWLLLRSIRLVTGAKRPPRLAVTRAWRGIERSLGDKLVSPEAGGVRALYLELRFGPREPKREDVLRLKRSAAELIRSFASR